MGTVCCKVARAKNRDTSDYDKLVTSGSNKSIELKIIEASNLTAGDFLTASDPYCRVQLGDMVYETKVLHRKGVNPKFNTSLYFPENCGTGLFISIWDSDRNSEDDLMGKMSEKFDIGSHLSAARNYGEPQEITLDLCSSVSKGKKATLKISIGVGRCVTAVPPPMLGCIVNYSSTAGCIRCCEGKGFRAFQTFSLSLNHINKSFGDCVVPWCRAAPNAQKIYGPEAASSILTAVKAEHYILYRTGSMRTHRTTVRSGSNFISLLNSGEHNGSPCMYTYVIVDDDTRKVKDSDIPEETDKKEKSDPKKCSKNDEKNKDYDTGSHDNSLVSRDGFNGAVMRFSETGASVASDFLSKHAVHANGKRAVRFAGEFFVDKLVLEEGDADYTPGAQRWGLVFDSASGTFAPPEEAIPKLLSLLKLNFPDIPIRCYGYQDSRLGEARRLRFGKNIPSGAPPVPAESQKPIPLTQPAAVPPPGQLDTPTRDHVNATPL